MPCVSHEGSVSHDRSLWCTYSVQVKVSQSVLQSVVVFANGDLRLEPWGKSQPATAAAEENIKCNRWRCDVHHASLCDIGTRNHKTTNHYWITSAILT